jgi:ribosome-associated heat shock protein Hsp15
MSESVRMDKFLWVARVYKTRSQATEACKSGKVSIDGMAVKASREVKPGDTICVDKEQLLRT